MSLVGLDWENIRHQPDTEQNTGERRNLTSYCAEPAFHVYFPGNRCLFSVGGVYRCYKGGMLENMQTIAWDTGCSCAGLTLLQKCMECAYGANRSRLAIR